MNNIMKVKVRETEKVIFEGEIDRISSYNEVGPFDIYPMHANFITIIRKELTLYKDKKVATSQKLEQGILKIKNDEVHIFLGIETLMLDSNDSPQKPAQPNDSPKTK